MLLPAAILNSCQKVDEEMKAYRRNPFSRKAGQSGEIVAQQKMMVGSDAWWEGSAACVHPCASLPECMTDTDACVADAVVGCTGASTKVAQAMPVSRHRTRCVRPVHQASLPGPPPPTKLLCWRLAEAHTHSSAQDATLSLVTDC